MADMVSAGASAGSAFGPWGSAIGGALGILGSVAGAGASAPAGPAISSSTPLNTIDFSDWTVSTGKSRASGSSDGVTLQPWMIMAGMALAAVVAVKWIKSK